MGKMYFRDIDHTNKEMVQTIKLKAGQETYIESVEECLQEADTYKEWHPVAIYNDETIIGFAMYGSFGPNKDTWMDRIMIDEQFQGKGLGKEAIMKLIDVISKEYGVNDIYLSIIEENEVAYHLYKNIGFKSINERDPNGELIFKYTISERS